MWPFMSIPQQQQPTNSLEQSYLDLMRKAMPNPLVNAGVSVATSALSGIASLLGGDSEEEKLLKDQRARGNEVFGLLKNRYAQSGNEPQQYLAEFMRSTQQDRARDAEAVGQRLNLDSGVAQGQLLNSTWEQFLKYSLGAQERGTRRKDDLLGMMAGMGR